MPLQIERVRPRNKDHRIVAASVGGSGARAAAPAWMAPLRIKAIGRKRVHGNDRFGFPKCMPQSAKRVHGFQTGELAKLSCTSGRSVGVHVGRIASIRARGWFVLNKQDWPAREFRLLERADGYESKTSTTVRR